VAASILKPPPELSDASEYVMVWPWASVERAVTPTSVLTAVPSTTLLAAALTSVAVDGGVLDVGGGGPGPTITVPGPVGVPGRAVADLRREVDSRREAYRRSWAAASNRGANRSPLFVLPTQVSCPRYAVNRAASAMRERVECFDGWRA
jgi:hypothetical protein